MHELHGSASDRNAANQQCVIFFGEIGVHAQCSLDRRLEEGMTIELFGAINECTIEFMRQRYGESVKLIPAAKPHWAV
jgi:hypothetical protein